MNQEPTYPGATDLDYQCLLGNYNITARWLVSEHEPDVVAAWYRARLAGYAEIGPDRWLMGGGSSGSGRLVNVGHAHAWPKDAPRPQIAPPATARTLILHSTMSPGMRPAGADPEGGA